MVGRQLRVAHVQSGTCPAPTEWTGFAFPNTASVTNFCKLFGREGPSLSVKGGFHLKSTERDQVVLQ